MSTDADHVNAGGAEASPVILDAAAAADLLAGLRFQVDDADLKRAFGIVDGAGDNQRIELRVTSDALVLAGGSKGMHCQARMPLTEPCGVPAAQVLVLSTETALFTDLLCNPAIRTADIVEFAAPTGGPGTAKDADRLKSLRWAISTGELQIRWPYEYIGMELVGPGGQAGEKVHPHAIAWAVSRVRQFAARDKQSPHRATVAIANGQAQGFDHSARVVELPDLAGAELYIARDHARRLSEVVKRFDRNETRLWTTPAEHAFEDEQARCTVARSAEPPWVEPRLELDSPQAACATAESLKLLDVVYRALAQKDSKTQFVRLTLEGLEEGTLWISIGIEGGQARAGCPVHRFRADGGPGDFETEEAEVDEEFLALLGALPNGNQVELRFLISTVSFTEKDNERVVRTHLAKKREK